MRSNLPTITSLSNAEKAWSRVYNIFHNHNVKEYFLYYYDIDANQERLDQKSPSGLMSWFNKCHFPAGSSLTIMNSQEEEVTLSHTQAAKYVNLSEGEQTALLQKTAEIIFDTLTTKAFPKKLDLEDCAGFTFTLSDNAWRQYVRLGPDGQQELLENNQASVIQRNLAKMHNDSRSLSITNSSGEEIALHEQARRTYVSLSKEGRENLLTKDESYIAKALSSVRAYSLALNINHRSGVMIKMPRIFKQKYEALLANIDNKTPQEMISHLGSNVTLYHQNSSGGLIMPISMTQGYELATGTIDSWQNIRGPGIKESAEIKGRAADPKQAKRQASSSSSSDQDALSIEERIKTIRSALSGDKNAETRRNVLAYISERITAIKAESEPPAKRIKTPREQAFFEPSTGHELPSFSADNVSSQPAEESQIPSFTAGLDGPPESFTGSVQYDRSGEYERCTL